MAFRFLDGNSDSLCRGIGRSLAHGERQGRRHDGMADTDWGRTGAQALSRARDQLVRRDRDRPELHRAFISQRREAIQHRVQFWRSCLDRASVWGLGSVTPYRALLERGHFTPKPRGELLAVALRASAVTPGPIV